MPSQRKRAAHTAAARAAAAAIAEESAAQREEVERRSEERAQLRETQRAERDSNSPFARPDVSIGGGARRWPRTIRQPEASMSAEEREQVEQSTSRRSASAERATPTAREE